MAATRPDRALDGALWGGVPYGDKLVALAVTEALRGADPLAIPRSQVRLALEGDLYEEMWDQGLAVLARDHPRRWLDACAALELEPRVGDQCPSRGPLNSAARGPAPIGREIDAYLHSQHFRHLRERCAREGSC